MIIKIDDWVRNTAIRFRKIVDSPASGYSSWDLPIDRFPLSPPAVRKVQKEITLLDVEEVWGIEERLKVEERMKSN